jgi:CRISPR system Cascade subunit CasA
MPQDSEPSSYNLVEEPWIPIRRQNGKEEWIRPWEVTGHVNGASPITKLAAPRPDFNGALIQFLVGLVQTAFGPQTQREWRRTLQDPPRPSDLKDAFEGHAKAFSLDGDTPRFCQDKDKIPDAPQRDIAELLVDSPSNYALRQNRDHFVKDRSADRYCAACTATALYALQANAPQGGRGHRTSLRGGGPVSTLVLGRTLWHTVWLNVLPLFAFRGDHPGPTEAVYPWLGSTRTSEDDQITTPEDAYPLQAFWGMPRRIFLEESLGPGSCSLCGRDQEELYGGYRTTNYGFKYGGAWEHPLTPYYRTDDGELSPHLGQQDGFSYRHWRGFAAGGDERNQRARVVRQFYDRSRYSELDRVFEGRPRLWVFGFEADRTKIRAWHESRMPLYRVSDEVLGELETIAAQFVEVADLVASNLKRALRKALYGYPTRAEDGNTEWEIARKAQSDGRDDPLEKTFFNSASVQFWQDTETDYYRLLAEAVQRLEAEKGPLDDLRQSWAKVLPDRALDIFDETTQSAQFRSADPKALAVARQELKWFSGPRSQTVRNRLDLPSSELERTQEG